MPVAVIATQIIRAHGFGLFRECANNLYKAKALQVSGFFGASNGVLSVTMVITCLRSALSSKKMLMKLLRDLLDFLAIGARNNHNILLDFRFRQYKGFPHLMVETRRYITGNFQMLQLVFSYRNKIRIVQ